MSYLTDSFDDRVISLLMNGRVGIVPTDTIYGLSCRALDKQAVERLRDLKERSYHKPLIVLVSNLKMLDLLSIDQKQAELVKNYWPGPLSVIFDAPNAPNRLTRGAKTLAVRWPADKNLCQLIDKVGPLVSTSANPEGKTPAILTMEAKKYFGDKVDFYVDVGKLENKPSAVVEIKDGRLKVVRQGSIRMSE